MIDWKIVSYIVRQADILLYLCIYVPCTAGGGYNQGMWDSSGYGGGYGAGAGYGGYGGPPGYGGSYDYSGYQAPGGYGQPNTYGQQYGGIYRYHIINNARQPLSCKKLQC